MRIFCIEEFKNEFDRVSRKNSYKELEKEIINYFFDEKLSISDINNGVNLNKSKDTPYIKKRFKGSGGFRIYFLLIIIDHIVYLMYVHPKSGTFGRENIDKKLRTGLYKSILACIKKNNLYSVTVSRSDPKKLVFEKVKEQALVIK